MISIIIPTYREEKWIVATIVQFKKLAVPHEIIVSDGKSLDRTVEISLQYADKVIVFDGGRQHNAAIGRNDGAKVASGKYLVFVDASVTVPHINDFFEKALAHFERDATLVCLNVYQWISPDETWADRAMMTLTNWSLRFQSNVLHYGMGSGKFMMMRKTAFEKVGGFREELAVGEDGDMTNRLAKIGRTYVDPGLCVYYPGRREHALGWPRLLWTWMRDWTAVRLFGRSKKDAWEAIR